MNEYSPNINERPQYEKAPDADILALYERLLDFADAWYARQLSYSDKVMVEAIADDEETVLLEDEELVRVRHTVDAVFEDYSDMPGTSCCTVTVGSEVKRRLIQFDEVDGQIRVGNDLIPGVQTELYVLNISDREATATVASMDLRENRFTVRDMTRYDVRELTELIDLYLEDASNDESSQYADNE